VLVDVGGRRLFLDCAGHGQPTVVLDAGMGRTSETWSLAQPAVASFTRVCAYDRAGLGRSDPAPRPRTCADAVADLDALLTGAAVPGPYVLVGHSFGGLIARLYAHTHRDRVAGLVLVDAPHPDYPARALDLLPPETPGESAEVAESRRFFAQAVCEEDPPESNPEAFAMGRSLSQARAAAGLGDLPLVVLSAGRHEPFPSDFPPDLAAQVGALVRTTQAELAWLSSRSAHVLAERSGHDVHRDQPDLVVAAVRRVVDLSRA
jgi:pimeloyl-ACP methyl ester carboxylesterase